MDIGQIHEQLRLIVEFNLLQESLKSVEGFLLDPEGYALMLLAAYGDGDGAIVEIGSYMGRSTCWLGVGAKTSGREKIHAVDHFRGSPEHQVGGGAQSDVLLREGTTYHRFVENLKTARVSDRVVPHVGSSEEAAAQWDGPIRLLFIDGDHSYACTRQDFELWEPFVVDSGLVAFHDIGNAEGSTRFYLELMQETSRYEEIMRVASLAIIRKRPVGDANGASETPPA